ncbi:hypothetical protein DITRI_Ditri01bG0193200 [Diplodiscus trichospermus]
MLEFMELPLTYVTLFLTFVFLFMAVKILKRKKANKPTVKLPPGPWKLPLIGNIHQLASSMPHHTPRDLAEKYGPLMHLQLGEVPTIVVSSAEIAKEVMKTNDIIFSQRPYVLAADILSYNSSAIVFTPYGNYWKQMKKICTMELLSQNRVQSFQSIREEEVSDLIKFISLNEGSPINLSEKIFSLSYGITARSALGKKSKGQEEFMRLMSEVAKLAAGFCLADMYPSSEVLKKISGMRFKLKKVHQASDMILENIVIEHKEKRNKMIDAAGKEQVEGDLVDVLLKLQEQGDLEIPLTNGFIKAVIQDIFGAGSETSATTIEWAMSELLKNTKLMNKAQNEIRGIFGNGKVKEERIHELKFLRSIVKETLRLHPPAPLLIPRECSENCVINGFDIPAKTKVLINVWAIQRDPCYWKESEKFYPERFLNSSVDFRGTNFEFIPFGAGRRICPGISFGLPSVELTLANLLYHFDWKLPNGKKFEDLDMNESFGVSVRRKNDLFLLPIPYTCSN